MLLGAETLLALLALVALLAATEALAGLTLAAADTGQLTQAVLDVTLAVVRLVRDPGDEVIDVGRGVEVRRADLTELVKEAVAELPPVLTELLLHLLALLLLLLLAHLLIPFSVVIYWRAPRCGANATAATSGSVKPTPESECMRPVRGHHGGNSPPGA